MLSIADKPIMLSVIMLNAIMPNVIMLIVIMQNVIMLSAEKGRVLHYTRLERPVRDKTLQLICPNRKLQRNLSVMNTTPGTIFTTHQFFVTYEWAEKGRVLHYTRLERPARDKILQLVLPNHKLR
jgi:hypothetical protein